MKGIRLKKNKTTKEETNAKNIAENGVETYGGEFLVYFLVQPDNIAVLSESAVASKVKRLAAVMKGFDSLEMACINSRENFESNKHFYQKRMAEEKSQAVRELLERDMKHLDEVQVQTASAREFLFLLRFRDYNPEADDVRMGISRMEKLLKDEGFSARLATKEDIKRLYAVYFVQNITQVYFDDYDGAQFVKGDGYF
jgi:hypothetical protein